MGNLEAKVLVERGGPRCWAATPMAVSHPSVSGGGDAETTLGTTVEPVRRAGPNMQVTRSGIGSSSASDAVLRDQCERRRSATGIRQSRVVVTKWTGLAVATVQPFDGLYAILGYQ
jgi:hypothetical protein